MATRRKTAHPADIDHDARAAAPAVRYDIHLRLSPGRVIKGTAHTLEKAHQLAAEADSHSTAGRRAGIYAIDANGRATFINRPGISGTKTTA